MSYASGTASDVDAFFSDEEAKVATTPTSSNATQGSDCPAEALQNPKLIVGLMSGTSMDGVDAALLRTDGESVVDSLCSVAINYSPTVQTALKSLEYAVASSKGDVALAKTEYAHSLSAFFAQRASLATATNSGPDLLSEWRTAMGAEFAEFDGSFDSVLAVSVTKHAEAVQALLSKARAAKLIGETKSPELVGYHGQTVYHAPDRGISIQLGNAALLASKLALPVVSDFRSNDVAHGGQGAPLAPIYHRALLQKKGIRSALMVNCGGITNVTLLQEDDSLLAYDAGPGSRLIDLYLQAAGIAMDEDGAIGMNGSIVPELWHELLSTCFDSMGSPAFLDRKPPRSLDANDMRLPDSIDSYSQSDVCATLEAFSAFCVVDSIDRVLQLAEAPECVVLCGGGWKNKVITREFKERFTAQFGAVSISRAEELGLEDDCLEAELIAYLALRSEKQLPLTFPGTTGVQAPLSGGTRTNATTELAVD